MPESQTEELLELLGARGKVRAKIKTEFSDLPPHFQLLVLEESDARFYGYLEILKRLQEKEYTGVVVTLNRPVSDFKEILEKDGLDTGKLGFVDGITLQSRGSRLEQKNVVYLETLKDLVELSVQIERTLGQAEGEKRFLLFDSLTTLLVYNERSAVQKFVHSVIGKLRAGQISGIFLIAAHADAEVLDTLRDFCDKVLRI